jgi:hypothetical protein
MGGVTAQSVSPTDYKTLITATKQAVTDQCIVILETLKPSGVNDAGSIEN